MKKAILILMAAWILYGCSHDNTQDTSDPRSVTIEIKIQPDKIGKTTRATDEVSIKDVNVYLYNNSGEIILHHYHTSPTLQFQCVPGNYQMRVAANLGHDMGENPASEDFIVTHADEYNILPMFYEGDVTIPPAGGTLPAVEVQRIVAKISYNIAVQPTDIELQSVQLRSVPRSVSPFDATVTPSDNPDDYTDCPETEISGKQATGTCYLLSNMQGSVPSITDQRQKNKDNAPGNASYLLIRALAGNKVLTYTVFLGENNTSDFNVRANVQYQFNISILGNNEVDTRISAYTLQVWDDFDDYNYGGYCLMDGTRYLHIDVECFDGSAPTRGHLKLLSGDLKGFTFNYGDTGAEHDFDLYDMNGDNTYEMEYTPKCFTEKNSLLAYRITLVDAHGFTQSYDFEHRMANAAIIRTDGEGGVRVEGALHVETESDGSGERTVALCMESCILTAVPDAGTTFAGWYDGPQEYGHLLSTEETYEYIPLGPLRYIYAVFQSKETPLDAGSTANCYIARSLNTIYSFDATTMGNGKTTLNISPQKLSGTHARVIWETGSVPGTVIENVEYKSGRIIFKTGTEHGNALIGLFDASENCIWSWHIWSVDYDIETSGQTYASGAVFMDRNLGALTTDYMQAAAKGLYYQWGRKDPFMYPSTFQQNSWNQKVQAPATYMPGFEYTEITATSEWEEMMSPEWAAAHPSNYINPLFPQDWDDFPSVSDWSYKDQPNLWGNRTTTSIDKTTSKSIYDPCPPGWRVPDLESFKGIECVSSTAPYYVTIRYNGNATTQIPLGGRYFEIYSQNGTIGTLYTAAPYGWNSDRNYYYFERRGTGITFQPQASTTITTSDLSRYWASPVRCIRE